MPVYQAEQMKVGNHYFYSIKHFNDNLKKEPFFSMKKELSYTQMTTNSDICFLDVISDPYGIDVLVNECLEEDNFQKQVFVKISDKNILNKATSKILQEFNHLLSRFAGGIYIQRDEAVPKTYMPTNESVALLKKYWGKAAEFRNILVYENPELSNDIIPVSQGLLVDTIIKEYKNGCEGIQPRDIFITAPTGAGKSLIFQLPVSTQHRKGM